MKVLKTLGSTYFMYNHDDEKTFILDDELDQVIDEETKQ